MHRSRISFESPREDEKNVGAFVIETADERMITHSSTINDAQLRRVRRNGKISVLRHVCAAIAYLAIFIVLGMNVVDIATAEFNRDPANGASALCFLKKTDDPRPGIIEGKPNHATGESMCPEGYYAHYQPAFTVSYGEQSAMIIALTLLTALALWRLASRGRAAHVELQTRHIPYDQSKVQVFPLHGYAWDTLIRKLGDELEKYPHEMEGTDCLSRHGIEQHMIMALRSGNALGRQLDYGLSEYLLRTKELAAELARPNRPRKEELKATIDRMAESWATGAFPLIRSDFHQQFHAAREPIPDTEVLSELNQQNAEYEVRALIARSSDVI